MRQSKYRHLKGTPAHKSLNIENLRNLSKSIPGESNMFCANKKFCAVPLGGPGGLVAPIRVSISLHGHTLFIIYCFYSTRTCIVYNLLLLF